MDENLANVTTMLLSSGDAPGRLEGDQSIIAETSAEISSTFTLVPENCVSYKEKDSTKEELLYNLSTDHALCSCRTRPGRDGAGKSSQRCGGLACALTDTHTYLLDRAPPPAPPSCPAPSYLHKKDIVHGNLTLGTIFIQHDGLVKIGAGGTGRVY